VITTKLVKIKSALERDKKLSPEQVAIALLDAMDRIESHLKAISRKIKCDHCDRIKMDTEWQANPYDEYIRGEINMEFICRDCRQELLDDI